jgi:hypothetical protein
MQIQSRAAAYVRSELGRMMKASGRYADDADIAQTIADMADEVAKGADPEEVLHEEGFEPDYVFDLLDN